MRNLLLPAHLVLAIYLRRRFELLALLQQSRAEDDEVRSKDGLVVVRGGGA